METQDCFSTLIRQLQFHILTYISPTDLIALRATSKFFSKLVDHSKLTCGPATSITKYGYLNVDNLGQMRNRRNLLG